MRCFGSEFHRYLCELGGLGESGAELFRSNGVLIASRCISASGGCRHPNRTSVPGSRWSRRGFPAGGIHMETPESP